MIDSQSYDSNSSLPAHTIPQPPRKSQSTREVQSDEIVPLNRYTARLQSRTREKSIFTVKHADRRSALPRSENRVDLIESNDSATPRPLASNSFHSPSPVIQPHKTKSFCRDANAFAKSTAHASQEQHQKVWARRDDLWFYAGNIIRRGKRKFFIEFEDGDECSVLLSDVFAYTLEAGDVVHVRSEHDEISDVAVFDRDGREHFSTDTEGVKENLKPLKMRMRPAFVCGCIESTNTILVLFDFEGMMEAVSASSIFLSDMDVSRRRLKATMLAEKEKTHMVDSSVDWNRTDFKSTEEVAAPTSPSKLSIQHNSDDFRKSSKRKIHTTPLPIVRDKESSSRLCSNAAAPNSSPPSKHPPNGTHAHQTLSVLHAKEGRGGFSSSGTKPPPFPLRPSAHPQSPPSASTKNVIVPRPHEKTLLFAPEISSATALLPSNTTRIHSISDCVPSSNVNGNSCFLFENCSFFITNLPDATALHYEITNAGGTILSPEQASPNDGKLKFLVASNYCRTTKYLLALAIGIPRLHVSFIAESLGEVCLLIRECGNITRSSLEPNPRHPRVYVAKRDGGWRRDWLLHSANAFQRKINIPA